MPDVELPHVAGVDERGWRDRFAHNLLHSPITQTARFVHGIVISPVAYFQGINGYGELAKWLIDQQVVEVEDTRNEQEHARDFFSTVRERIDGEDAILGTSTAREWEKVKSSISHSLNGVGTSLCIADEIVLVKDGSWWGMGEQKNDGNSIMVFYHVLADGNIEPSVTVRSQSFLNDFERECFLVNKVVEITGDSRLIRNVVTISPVTNNIVVIHDEEWEREAGVIMRLVNRGSDSHDEIESLIQITLRRGLELSPDGASIILPNERIREMFEELYALSLGRENDYKKGKKILDINGHVDATFRRHLYHRYANEWLINNPDIVQKFMITPAFIRGREILHDHSMTSAGQSYFQDARNLLANAMLWKFEGLKRLANSPTQKQFEGYENEFTEALNFLHTHHVPLIRYDNQSVITGIRDQQYSALQQFRAILQHNDWLPGGLDATCSLSWRKALQDNYEVVFRQKLDDVRKEIDRRKRWHPIFIRTMEVAGFHVDAQRRHSVLTTLIGNIAMAKVLEKRSRLAYTAHAVLPDTLGFITDVTDKNLAARLLQLKAIEPQEAPKTARDIAKQLFYIFASSKHDVEGLYIGQALRTVEVASTIMEYLSNGEDVPVDVRSMSRIINNPELLMKEALKLSDPVWADNLNYVNIFFHGGRKQFHATTVMTWVRDFVNAVETEFKFREGLFAEGERRFIGWSPLDTDPSENDISSTIPIVLENVKERIRFINHQRAEEPYQGTGLQRMLKEILRWPGKSPVLFRDFMDIFETMFGSLTPTMEYIRKRYKWSKWTHVTAESWRCYCMMRDSHSFFNTRTAVAY